MTDDDTLADAFAALIEAHLSTGLGCHCGEWAIDTSRRPVDPRRQHRRHVAERLADSARRATAIRDPQIAAAAIESLAVEAESWPDDGDDDSGPVLASWLRQRITPAGGEDRG